MQINQFMITPASGKRLIAKALTNHIPVQKTLESGTLVIIAGTTNGYVAEEILSSQGQIDDFSKKKFFRGIVLPSSQPRTENGRLPDETGFPGDVVIVDGKWKKGLTIFDVADDLIEGDIILKGANALDVNNKKAAILSAIRKVEPYSLIKGCCWPSSSINPPSWSGKKSQHRP